MIEILSANTGMQNVYTPFPLKMHFIFCIIATVLYLAQFYRKGSWHYLLVMLAVDLTFLTQTSVCRSSVSIMVLGLAEVLLLGLSLYFYIQFSKKQKALRAASDAETDEKNRRRQEAEKTQQQEDKKIVDNAFEDD